jgi:hypothetical protein
VTRIARYECPDGHGESLTTLREREPNRWCAACQTWVEPVLVEYVRADLHEQAVAELRDLCERAVDALRFEANPVCDEWDDWLAATESHDEGGQG